MNIIGKMLELKGYAGEWKCIYRMPRTSPTIYKHLLNKYVVLGSSGQTIYIDSSEIVFIK